MKFFNTLSRTKQDLKTHKPHHVSLYTCGLTVYSQPHIGNWVAYIYWDFLQRLLVNQGYEVTRVQNITDVGHLTSDEDAGEDKMLKSALKEGVTAWEIADKYAAIADHEAYDLLGLLRPTYMPRATEYIDQQIAFVEKLQQKGYTYTIDDGVYFDTSKLKDYGKLAQLDIDGLQFGVRVADTGKKNLTDFAVWKFSNPDEKRDMEWDSPWGKGFPGWHLECSVMALELLGDSIDIHTGGIDHIPVHHTNEIAQSESVTGKEFSTFWIHANHIKVNGTKMSKSLGNIYTLQDLLDKGYSLQAFKLLIASKHYRTEGNFTWDILDAAQNRFNGWQATVNLEWQRDQSDDVSVIDSITHALTDDLNTPAAIAAIDAYFRKVNDEGAAPNMDAVDFIENIFGFVFSRDDVNVEQKYMLDERAQAREAKDWNTSDKLRDTLKEQGIGVNDDARGQTWYRL